MTNLKFADFVRGGIQREDFARSIEGEPINIVLTLSRTHYGAWRVDMRWHRCNRTGSGSVTSNVFKAIDKARKVFAYYSDMLEHNEVFLPFIMHTTWSDET
jgi:hypothetical protein